MAYATTAQITQSTALMQRLIACAAEQKKVKPYQNWVLDRIWDIAVSPGWSAKWESAVASENPDPGADPAVISDQDILGVIQPMQ